MKKNLVLFLGVALFVALFYNQGPGLNLSFFAILSWSAVFLTTRKENHTALFWWLTGALGIAAGAFAWYGDPVSFLAVFASLALLVCKAHEPVMHVLLVPFASAANFISFIFRAPVLTGWLPVNGLLTVNFYKKAIYYFLVPGALAVSFLVVYSSGSSLFQSFFHINWNADFLQIGFLTTLGFFLMFSIVHYWAPSKLTAISRKLKDHFPGTAPRQSAGWLAVDAGFYQKSAGISLIVLNIIVAFFITTYCIEQFGNGTTGNTLSNELHERVYLLIFSIVMAIFVILLFFRGILNFTSNTGQLKKYAYIWITLNLLLLIVVTLKNNQYVGAYGLTFKRLGVYFFLLLCSIGLFFTFLKIKNKKTNTYLVGRMVWAGYTALVIGASINWSWIVTKYNLEYQKTFDREYANSLSFNKQLLYDTGLLTKEALLQLQHQHQVHPLLSQNLYYTTLNHH
ncbi:DUF4173 domain-containing protein [Niabella sp.]|uniref:DUF4173 domain-containing protein n=1 Tax=Niabella sp. TaxID=1962976 RepID=UPI0026264B4D|nr:DUF4173 domain-containing protein [Niabella sp.]